jgi:hypothetical protein
MKQPKLKKIVIAIRQGLQYRYEKENRANEYPR